MVKGDDGEAVVVRVVDTLDDSAGIADYEGVGEDEFGVILNEYLKTGRASTGKVGGAHAELIDGQDSRRVCVVDWIVTPRGRAAPTEHLRSCRVGGHAGQER